MRIHSSEPLLCSPVVWPKLKAGSKPYCFIKTFEVITKTFKFVVGNKYLKFGNEHINAVEGREVSWKIIPKNCETISWIKLFITETKLNWRTLIAITEPFVLCAVFCHQNIFLQFEIQIYNHLSPESQNRRKSRHFSTLQIHPDWNSNILEDLFTLPSEKRSKTV